MSKRLKIIIISIIVFIIGICISNITFAWSPANQSPIYPQGDYYCREKGGSVRFSDPQFYLGWRQDTFRASARDEYFCPCGECRTDDRWTSFTDYKDYWLSYGKQDIENIWGRIAEQAKTIWLGGRFTHYNNGMGGYPLYSGTYSEYGPIIARTPILNTVGTPTRVNDTVAFIFSSRLRKTPMSMGFNKGNYTTQVADSASNTDVQNALWADPTYNIGNILGANALYTEAKEYENFYKTNIASGYMNKVQLNDSNAQVIVKRSARKYVVGPYTVTYPQNDKFAYIEEIYVTTNTGGKLTPRVIFQQGAKPYPASGQQFFLEFDGSSCPTSATVNVKFAYLELTKATYEQLAGKGELLQFRLKWENTSKTHVGEEHEDSGRRTPKEYDSFGRWTGGGDVIYQRHRHSDDGMNIWIEVVHYGYYPAQAAGHYLDSDRIWKCDDSTTKKSTIDLTMELGGIVWVDNTGGKESVNDSKYGSTNDTPMSNVPVTLYTAGGGQVGSTTTGGDGKYKFSGLNAMYQYFVKFTYNSQYYEPVNYEGASSWAGSNWRVNSNGTDKVEERNNINARFASIGSTPNNYTGASGANKTYTRTELKNSGAIDEFGNLTGGDSSQSQFIRDCQLESYTGNGTGGTDLYPVWDTFVIDDHQNLSMLVGAVNVLYDTAYYINQGYKERQVADMALRKDVEKATIEINGKIHTYDYDTRKITDTQPTTNNGKDEANLDSTWDINIRLSDGYYNEKYSRELYKSDYAYKVSNYGTNFADYGKDKSDELNVYVTYKITVRNQSMSIRTRIDEIVDYYDEDYTYQPDRSYIEIKSGTNAGKYATIGVEDQSRYGAGTQLQVTGYKNLYIRGMGQNSNKIDETGKVTGTINDGIYLDAGQTAYVYVTFKVNKNEQNGESWVILDETIDEAANAIGVGKENVTEINGFSTIYGYGTNVPNVGDVTGRAAGLIDKDSNPGNLRAEYIPKDGTISYQNFEDDTDKAPDIRVILYKDDAENRTISGSVWEDTRNETIGATTTGDGLNKNETPINGVTVQLVELMYINVKDSEGKIIGQEQREFIWRTFEEGSGTAKTTKPIINVNDLVKDYNIGETGTGKYAFKSFMPGNYVIRFIYGDTEKTVLTSDVTTSVNKELGKTGLNLKSYNGQDFKSTTYQEGVAQTEKTYTWRQPTTWLNGRATIGAIITPPTKPEINELSLTPNPNPNPVQTYKDKYNQNETNSYLYDITESEQYTNVSDAKDIESRRQSVIEYSDKGVINNVAETLASHEELPCDKTQLGQYIEDLKANTNMTAETGLMNIELEYDRDQTQENVVGNHTVYPIKTVDLGLEERPKAQLAINKEVTNVKVTLANGSVLFDAQGPTTNVLWHDHEAYDVGYEASTRLLDASKFGNIENIRNKNAQKFGLIQLSMDEELMHGSTIKISYNITVSNVGEADYNDNEFYYTGNIADKNIKNSIVKTKADQVIDYVENNLQFNAANNSDWKVITQDELQKTDKSQDLVNHTLKDEVAKYNTIITTGSLGTELIPTIYKDKIDGSAIDNVTVPLILTQLITSENDTDDLTYFNTVEIVKTSNTVGRRNNFSVVGNQNPKGEITEMDSDRAEEVKILPPFGDTSKYFTIGAIIAGCSLIMIGGIIFIKKKVLK